MAGSTHYARYITTCNGQMDKGQVYEVTQFVSMKEAIAVKKQVRVTPLSVQAVPTVALLELASFPSRPIQSLYSPSPLHFFVHSFAKWNF